MGLILFLLISILSPAQEPSVADASRLAQLKETTDRLIRNREYPEALKAVRSAIEIAERSGDRNTLGDLTNELGVIYRFQNRMNDALESFRKSLDIQEQIGNRKGVAHALANIGNAQWRQGRLPEALGSLEKGLARSEELGDRSLTASVLSDIGVVYRYQGKYALALEYYQRSRALCEELNDKATLKKLLNSMGNVYQSEGRYELALEYYERSRAICEELGDKVNVEVALANIANIHDLQGRYVEALACLQRGIKINEEMGSAGDRRALAMLLGHIGFVYRHQGLYDLALDYQRRSLEIAEELGDKRQASVSVSNIGILYALLGQDQEALQWHEKALALQQEVGDKWGIASTLTSIGDIHRTLGRYDLALEYLQKSLRSREEMGDQAGIVQSLNNLGLLWENRGDYARMLDVSQRAVALTKAVNEPASLWVAQDESGRALRALGLPDQARRCFQDAVATVESLRLQVAGGAQGQQGFLNDRLSPYVELVSLLVSQREYADAINYAERSKARVLLDAFQGGRANLHRSLSTDQEKTEEEHRLQLVEVNSQLTRELRREKPDQERIAQLRSTLEKARIAFEALETDLYVAHPELRVQRGEASTIRVEELADLLPDPGTALLEYVVTDPATYLFAVTSAPGGGVQVQAFTLPVGREELSREAENFRQQLAGRDLGFRGPAQRLYRVLLGPAESLLSGKSNLVIVPDDQLWGLPFQALLTGRDRYLVETSAVAYAPSLTVLREMRARAAVRDAQRTTLLAFGNPTVGKDTSARATLVLRDERLDPLPEAEQEVHALARLYGPSRSTVYVGAEATEDRVKAEAGRAGVLHFATHGILNDAAPMYSHLVLAQGGPKEDGLLEAWELMNLDLKASLAVLSACDTARGRYGAGEGVIGLTWALFVAGVPSTVVSQWQVESAGTRDLMLNFHRALGGGGGSKAPARPTKAEALRQAELKLMRSAETSHPFYWASFVLVGDGR